MLIEFTQEEQQHIKDIQDGFKPEWERITALLESTADKEERLQLIIKRQAIYDSMVEVLDAYSVQCQKRRFEPTRQQGVVAIIMDAKAQAPHILELIHKETVSEFEGADEVYLEEAGIGTVKKGRIYVNADYATKWLKDELRLHIEALQDNPEGLRDLLAAIIEAVDVSKYTAATKPTGTEAEALKFKHTPLSITPDSAIFKPNMPMYHGKATDALATLSHKDITEKPLADKATLQTPAGDYKVVIQNFSKVKGNLSVNTHKLFSVSIAEFTQINNYGGGGFIPKVAIPFDEYARKVGYKIDEKETSTPEEAEKEKKRAREAYKTAKKRISQDVDLLLAMRLTWEEKIKGKGKDFDSINLFERGAIKKGYIILEFGRHMAEYLKSLPITQYPQGLLAIDARSDNAYNMGLKMTEHYNMDNNQVAGTANRLKVSTLLAVTSLPTIEDLQNEKQDNSRQWYARTKEPFEKALDILTGKVIKNWEYVKSKGKPLTEEEAYSITDYETFTSLYVQFELLEAPDHTDRLERRAEDKRKAATRQAAKKKAAGNKKPTDV